MAVASSHEASSLFRPADATDSSVVSLLQKSKLFRDYQQAFEVTTGLPLVLRAAGSFLAPLHGSTRINRFCSLMIKESKSCASCLQVQQRLEDTATHQPKTLKCNSGLSESAIPVRVGDKVLAYLQTGQIFLTSKDSPRSQRIAMLKQSGLTSHASEAMKTAYLETRVISRSKYGLILKLLRIFAEHLGSISNQILITRGSTEPAALTKIHAYISDHSDEQIGLVQVARIANMSTCHLCRIFKQATGLTFTDYLARKRIESAKRMLQNVNTRISEAAYASGFQSLSQFNRVFLRVMGESPSNYRNHLDGLPRSYLRTSTPSQDHAA